MKVTVYLADVSRLNIPHALGAVTDSRREKALRLYSDDAKRRSLGAALLMYMAVSGGTPFDPEYGAYGKPFHSGGPCFSLSHSESFAACAVADCELGLDIEVLRRKNLSVAERIFSREELSSMRTDEDFTRLWVKRESIGKAAGTGILLPLPEGAEECYKTSVIRFGELFIAVSAKGDEPPELILKPVTPELFF